MILQNMLFHRIFKTLCSKFSFLTICLLVNNLNLTCGVFLSVACNRQKYMNECPFHSNSQCDESSGFCQCKPGYPLLLSPFTPCLNYQELNDECVHSFQCNITSNAVCYDENMVELNEIEPLIQWFMEMSDEHEKYDYRPNMNWGKCQCVKHGYKLSLTNKCERVDVSELLCDGSRQCTNRDLNSHCNRKTNRCTCDAGYFYDTHRDKCVIAVKKLGDSCSFDLECKSWDINMVCRSSICVCHNSYDLTTQRCKQMGLLPRCRYGYIRDEITGDCHITHGYNPNIRRVTADKAIEMMIVLIFFVIIVFVLRYWRILLPSTYYGYYENLRLFSDINNRNNSQIHRRTPLESPRVIHLRLNLESEESYFIDEETAINMRIPESPSASSLPPYESPDISGASVDPQLPPYIDAPPTYEEAMASANAEEININTTYSEEEKKKNSTKSNNK